MKNISRKELIDIAGGFILCLILFLGTDLIFVLFTDGFVVIGSHESCHKNTFNVCLGQNKNNLFYLGSAIESH